jgi:predicted permease
VLSLITGVAFGIVPAWVTSHGDPAEALKAVNRAAGDRDGLLQRSLIVFQAALSLVLLVGAGLLTRSLRNLEHQDFGFQTANRYVLHLDPLGAGYKPEQLEALNQSLEQQFAAIPGMESVGLAIYSPLDGNDWSFDAYIPGRPKPGPQDESVLINRVSPNFLAAVGQPVIRGRGLSDGDTAGSQFVAVINQAFAKKYFPNEDPIGRHFGVYDREDLGAYEIVGVVADAKYKQPRENAQAMFFGPLSQWQHNLKNPTAINLETQTHYITSVVMSFHGVPQNLEATLRGALAHIDPNLTILDLHSLDEQLAGNFNQARLVARLTALFGLLTLVLASVGLYGITSYQVAQRTREIGLRMALGAQRNRMATLVMRGALVQVVLGLAAGVPISLLGAHWIQSQLYAVKSYDPLSLFMAIVVLSTAAVLASFLPARRAASIDPMQALRAD